MVRYQKGFILETHEGIVIFEFLAVNIRIHYLNGSVFYTKLRMDENIRVRLCLIKHQRHRVAHEVIAGPGYKSCHLFSG